MGNKVRCKFCKFEQQRKCMAKNVTMKINKKRMCSIYQADGEKIKDWLSRRENLPSEALPKWAWNRKDRRAERNRVAREEMMKQYGTTADQENPQPAVRDMKHPSTGDLGRFVGTTTEEKN